jgi:hypothetical protein
MIEHPRIHDKGNNVLKGQQYQNNQGPKVIGGRTRLISPQHKFNQLHCTNQQDNQGHIRVVLVLSIVKQITGTTTRNRKRNHRRSRIKTH